MIESLGFRRLAVALGLLLATSGEFASAFERLTLTERSAIQSRLERLGYADARVDRQDLLEAQANLLIEDMNLPTELVLDRRPDFMLEVLDREIERRKSSQASFYLPQGFGASANAARLSPDGRFLGMQGSSRIAVFDTRTGNEIASIRSFSKYFSFLSRSTLMVIAPYGRLTWYDCALDTPVRTADILRWNFWNVHGVAAHPDPQRRVAAVVNIDDGVHRVAVIDADTQAARTIELVQHPKVRFDPSVALSFSPNGERLAYATNKLLIVWDLNSGKRLVVRSFDTNDDDREPKVAFSADGSRLAVMAGKERKNFGEINLDAPDAPLRFGRSHGLLLRADGTPVFLTAGGAASGRAGTEAAIIPTSNEVLDTANGVAVTQSNGRYFLWDVEARRAKPIAVRQNRILAARYDKARRTMMVVHQAAGLFEVSIQDGTPRLIKAASQNEDVEKALQAAGSAMFVDDRRLLLGNGRTFYLVDTEAWRVVWTADGPPTNYVATPWLWTLANENSLRVVRRSGYNSWLGSRDYDLSSGNVIANFSGDMPYKVNNFFAWASRHARYVATTDTAGQTHVIDVTSGAIVKTIKPDFRFERLRPFDPPPAADWRRHFALYPYFADEGRYLAVRVSDVRGRSHPDYFIYDTETFTQVANFTWPQHMSWLVQRGNHDDDEASLIVSDGSVARYDPVKQRIAQVYSGAAGSTLSTVDDRDAGRVIAVGAEGAIVIWNRETGALLTTTVLQDEDWITMTGEGYYAGDGDILSRIGLKLPSAELLPADRLRRTMMRPDLVAAKLAGDPGGAIALAQSQISLSRLSRRDAAPTLALTGTSDARAGARLILTVADGGYGVGRIEWRRNGVLVKIDSNVDVSSGQAELRRDIDLEPGLNRIEVQAYEATGLIASEPAVFSATAPSVFDRPAKLFVLVIGIDDYVDTRLKLKYAGIDARSIGRALTNGARSLYEDVDIIQVLDRDAVESRIDGVFADLAQRIAPQDIFILFVAGHGKTADGRFVFLPADFRYESEASLKMHGIGQDHFESWLLNIRASRTLMLFDTCESGSLVGLDSKSSDSQDALARFGQSAGRSTITAATDRAPALEGYRGHGVFTWTLLQAMSDGDANNDNLIDVEELARYLNNHVSRNTFEAFGRRQDPQMRLEGVNFPVARVLKAAASAADQVRDARPTHVLVRPVPVLATSDASAPKVGELPAGMLVRMVASERGWALVARNGRDVGHVDAGALAAMQ